MDEDYELILNHLKFSIDNNIIDENLEIADDLIHVRNVPNGACFDIDYYKKNYLKNENVDPIHHYLTIGAKKGFNPNKDFDGHFYLEDNPDVKRAGLNPLIHFLKYGLYEGRLPKLLTVEEVFNQNLKRTLKGKKGYLFLINDNNNELRQHFDENYESIFDFNKSLKVQKIKKDWLNSMNIPFYSFSVPDKSIICKDFLPFKFNKINRLIEQIDYIIDLKCEELNHLHYFKSDTHNNHKGGELLAFKILKAL